MYRVQNTQLRMRNWQQTRNSEMAASNYSQYSEYTPPAPEGKLLSSFQY